MQRKPKTGILEDISLKGQKKASQPKAFLKCKLNVVLVMHFRFYIYVSDTQITDADIGYYSFNL